MMKIPALLISAALLASPSVFAQEVSCDGNMNELATNNSLPLEQLDADTRSAVEEHIRQAGEAQAAGDEAKCVMHSDLALKEIRKVSNVDDNDGVEY